MWYKSENGSSTKPPAIDSTSSKKFVYVRKDFTLIPADEDKPEHWEWMEQKVRKEDWELYEKVIGHDDALDDVYAALTELAEIIAEGDE